MPQNIIEHGPEQSHDHALWAARGCAATCSSPLKATASCKQPQWEVYLQGVSHTLQRACTAQECWHPQQTPAKARESAGTRCQAPQSAAMSRWSKTATGSLVGCASHSDQRPHPNCHRAQHMSAAWQCAAACECSQVVCSCKAQTTARQLLAIMAVLT